MPIADISARLPQLEQMARQGAEPALMAEEVVQAWTRVDTVLRPIVGAKGVAALYGRSRQLAAQHHPWLGAGDTPRADRTLMDLRELRSQLAAQNVEDAVRASLEHLGQFDQLLGTFIGEVLKNQLLAQAGLAPAIHVADGAPPEAKET